MLRTTDLIRLGMLNVAEIDRIAAQAAAHALSPVIVSRVFSRPTLDSDGNGALAVTIVISPGLSDQITGEAAIKAMVGVGDSLSEHGEERFPILEFVTEEELAEVDDPES